MRTNTKTVKPAAYLRYLTLSLQVPRSLMEGTEQPFLAQSEPRGRYQAVSSIARFASITARIWAVGSDCGHHLCQRLNINSHSRCMQNTINVCNKEVYHLRSVNQIHPSHWPVSVASSKPTNKKFTRLSLHIHIQLPSAIVFFHSRLPHPK